MGLYAETDSNLEMSGCLIAVQKTKSLSKEYKFMFYEILEYADIICLKHTAVRTSDLSGFVELFLRLKCI
jgi:hypothetical protein